MQLSYIITTDASPEKQKGCSLSQNNLDMKTEYWV